MRSGDVVAVDDILPLGEVEYEYVSRLLYERFGIHLGSQKRILVAGRLSKRVRQLGLSSFKQYFELLRTDSSGDELSEFINRITTNHSFFYREKDHFDYLTKVILPEIRGKIKADAHYPMRMWSAGCASGEEVFTLAMVLREYFGSALETMDSGLLATDISLAALKNAQAGTYPIAKIQELPVPMRKAYFRETEPDSFVVVPDLRRMVLFKRLNLMSEKFPFKTGFDVIFCRNVMIYFDQGSRARLISAFYEHVKPGGYLFIGHSESIQRSDCPFDYVQPAIYRKRST